MSWGLPLSGKRLFPSGKISVARSGFVDEICVGTLHVRHVGGDPLAHRGVNRGGGPPSVESAGEPCSDAVTLGSSRLPVALERAGRPTAKFGAAPGYHPGLPADSDHRAWHWCGPTARTCWPKLAPCNGSPRKIPWLNMPDSRGVPINRGTLMPTSDRRRGRATSTCGITSSKRPRGSVCGTRTSKPFTRRSTVTPGTTHTSGR